MHILSIVDKRQRFIIIEQLHSKYLLYIFRCCFTVIRFLFPEIIISSVNNTENTSIKVTIKRFSFFFSNHLCASEFGQWRSDQRQTKSGGKGSAMWSVSHDRNRFPQIFETKPWHKQSNHHIRGVHGTCS